MAPTKRCGSASATLLEKHLYEYIRDEEKGCWLGMQASESAIFHEKHKSNCEEDISRKISLEPLMKKDWEIKATKYFRIMILTVLKIVCCRCRRSAKKGALKNVLVLVFNAKC
jgi:hypothetical protein